MFDNSAPLAKKYSPNLMKRRLVPVVEITTRPPRTRATKQPPASPTTTDPSTPSPRKKRRTNGDRSQGQSTLPASPTISDFEDGRARSSFKGDLPVSPPFHLAPPEEELRACGEGDLVASGSNKKVIYELMENEFPEDSILPGETLQDDSEYGRGEDIPVRLLEDFSIYCTETRLLVPVARLVELKFSCESFSASGLATPWVNEDEEENVLDEDEEDYGDGLRLTLGKILEFDVHSFNESTQKMDSKIYIRTQYAWYILDSPSQNYTPFFATFWIQHRVMHMILNASISKPKITYDEFIGLFEDDSIKGESDLLFTMASDDIGQSLNILGRTLTEDDVQDDTVKAYIIGSLEDLSYMHQLPLKNVPLICSYLGSDKFDLYEEDTGCKPKKKASTTRRKFSDKEQDVLKHRNTTVVTPTVAEIARRLFNGALEVAGSKAIDADVAVGIDNVRAHHSDPTSMVWGPKNGAFYQSVIMDDVEYFVSQDVMVNPGEDDDKDRARHSSSEACQSPNVYANRLWFCRICYFFEDIVDGEPVKMFHGQWFLPGSKTILQETAHSKSVYLLYQCADMPVASIIKECKVKMTAPGDTEIKDDARPDANDFHCSLAYDEKTADFFDIPGADEIREILNLVPHSPCLSCGIEKQKNDLAEFTPFAGGFARYGVEYHRHDFVYMRPQAKTGLLDIAQIIKIDNAPNPPEVTVQLFGRCDGLEGQKRKHISSILASDERQLYLRTKTRVLQLDDDNCIDGQCYVRQLLDPKEIEDWLRQDDHFFVLPKVDEDGENLRHCKRCYQKRLQKIEQDQTLLDRNGAITCLELFSGAGGLGTGMDMSGFVETKYAIEFSPSAAQTYQANHTNATVYCQDSNLLLKNAITAAAGKDPEPLISNDGVTVLPPMPKKNSIDFISGGPPCQSFSRANHNPRADDIRSTLPANMLSFVEHYEPRYFLLENVVGLLHYRFLSIRSKDKRSLQGGINAGMVKFIMRTLIALGYQVRFKVLQAGQYGAPQSRRRVIFWGAKRGFPIPDYPVPIYAFDKGMNSSNLPTARILPVSRSRDPDDPHQCAPLRAITVNDAISDLPPFDWINPHKIIPIKDRDRQERKKRVQEGISQFSAVAEPKMANLPGFPEGVEYESEPLNRYQQWLRRGKDGEPDATVVQAHYTQTFGSRVVEATTTVPLRPMAYHKHLPLVLQPDHAKPGAKQEKKFFYGRMDGDNQFNCAMTQVAPNQKGWVLHPSQKRIISVRECARAQGFPDYYDFQSADDKPQKMVINQMRQIGNAVPVPLAFHLGKSLGAALLKTWAKDQREDSPVV